jgi:hypothetical protein
MRLAHCVAAGLALGALSGCDLPLPGQGVRTFAVVDGSVNVRGPDGYCVDPTASRAATGFAVLGECGLIAATGIIPTADGFITVQVGPPDSATVDGSEAELAALLRSERGAALLSDSGRPSNVRIDQLDRSDGIIAVNFVDRGPPPVDGLVSVEWRAFLDVRGRLTTISVRGYERSPLTSAQAQALLYGTVSGMQGANRGLSAPAAPPAEN